MGWNRFLVEDILPVVFVLLVLAGIIGFVWWGIGAMYTSWYNTPINWNQKDEVILMVEQHPELKADVQKFMEDGVMVLGEFTIIKQKWDEIEADIREELADERFERSIW